MKHERKFSHRPRSRESTSPWTLSSPTGWLCSARPSSPKASHNRRFDKDVMDMDVHGHGGSQCGSPTSSLSQDEAEGMSRALSASLVVVDVLAGADQAVEDVILAPNVHKLPESALVKVTLQSNNEKVTMYCSSDILKMKSPFFGNILLEQENWRCKDADVRRGPGDTQSAPGLWRSPVVLAEAYPYEAAALLENMHENYLLNALAWNSTFCRLSVLWVLDEFIDNFAQLIDSHFEKCIHFIKSSNWRTNACLLEGMEIAVFSSDIGVEPILLTGKVVIPDSRVDYSSVRCALDASDVISTAPRNYSVASPVLTDAEMRSCLSAASTADSCSGSPNTYDQQKFLSESLIVNVKEPFWIMSEMTGGKWMSPDDYCQASKKLEVPQGDKRKFWEMLKLLHELPVLNKRCKNRIRTAEQVSQLFRRKEFAALWSAESADCMTTDALMCLVSAQMDKS